MVGADVDHLPANIGNIGMIGGRQSVLLRENTERNVGVVDQEINRRTRSSTQICNRL